MITRIEFIRNFGIFRDFRWTGSIPEFSKINLIYGWNYSGKTTLSRIFQAMEERVIPSEFSAGDFKVVVDDGSEIKPNNLPLSPHVRVFNVEYVRRNFQEEHTAPAVFILGQENVSLRTRLNRLRNHRDQVVRLSNHYSKKKEEVVSQLEKAGTDKARDIGQILGIRNFRRPNLQQRIEEVRGSIDSNILSDESIESRLQTVRSVEQYTHLNRVEVALPELIAIGCRVNKLLEQTASIRAIARLKESVQLENWVDEGLKLHGENRVCEFCGNPLTEARLSELRGHFSAEYESLIQGLRGEIDNLEAIIPVFSFIDELRLIPDQRARFSNAKTRFKAWMQWASGVRDELIVKLRKKQTAVETQMGYDGNLGKAVDGQLILIEINEAIESHNHAIMELDTIKAQAREDLEKHYSALYIRDGSVTQKEANIFSLTNKHERAERIRTELDSQIQEFQGKIQQSSIGAARLGELAKYLLADCNIDVAPFGDNSFQFTRNGHPATHLSEGEKTALTLAYFVTSLEAVGSNLQQTIVFIDDPVSSLDANHTYAVFALVVERMSQAIQLFVSTHNSEFFSLLKSKWLGRNQRVPCGAYQVWRSTDTAGVTNADLRDLPHLLRTYKSEYEFIFAQLYAFAEATSPPLSEAYMAPNMLRKFLEAYLSFRKGIPRSWSDKLDLLLDTAESRREIQKFADNESHLQTFGRALMHSDLISNSQRCVKIVLDALRMKDPVHYDALVSIAGVTT